MLFNSVARDSGCNCIGCGPSKYEGMGSPIQRQDGQYELIMICFGCLAKAAVGEAAFNKALGKTAPPAPIPAPDAIKPRWFGA